MNEMKRETRGHCNIIHRETGFKADIFFVGADSFQQWAIENAVEVNLSRDSVIRVAPVENVIVKKLEFYQEGQAQKHIRDIKSIMEYSHAHIDFKLLNRLISERRLEDVWLRVR